MSSSRGLIVEDNDEQQGEKCPGKYQSQQTPSTHTSPPPNSIDLHCYWQANISRIIDFYYRGKRKSGETAAIQESFCL